MRITILHGVMCQTISWLAAITSHSPTQTAHKMVNYRFYTGIKQTRYKVLISDFQIDW